MPDSEAIELPGLSWSELPILVRPDLDPDWTIQERFTAFHSANPWVYKALVDMAVALRNRGHRRFGVKLLFEALRYQYMIATNDAHSPWRLNNNLTSRYARLMLANEPFLADCLETRELRAA